MNKILIATKNKDKFEIVKKIILEMFKYLIKLELCI